ncbi:unnamed protein product, partial [marine sediment metagenome]
ISCKVKSANIAAIRMAVLSWNSTADTVTSDIVASWAATPTFVANWTAENTPADLTVTSSYTTVKVENIAVDTASMANIALFIWLPNEETITDVIYIKDIQMCEGERAIPFKPRSYQEEFNSCLRFCQVYGGSTHTRLGYAIGTAGTDARVIFDSTIPYRTIPHTITMTGTWAFIDYGGVSTETVTGISVNTTGSDFFGKKVLFDLTAAANLTAGDLYSVYANNDASAFMFIEAEL